MTVADRASLGSAEIEKALRAVEPAALLVPPRILRRVIKLDRALPGIGLQVPHRKSYLIGRDRLLPLAAVDELGIANAAELPDQLILLAALPSDRLAATPAGEVLRRYWRLLFHARVHQVLEQRLAQGKLTTADVRERIHRIGQSEFDEVRAVLRQERFLLPPRDQRSVYVEFVAVYLELRYFARGLLGRYFPTIHDFARIDTVLVEDVDSDSLFAVTRPAGADDPVMVEDCGVDEAAPDDEAEAAPSEVFGQEQSYPLLRRAKQAAKRGNLVRAALLRARAAHLVPTDIAGPLHAAARAELIHLAGRLQAALDLNAGEVRAWRKALPALLDRAARGVWPVEARFLYDLQKVCVDHERDLYAADLVEWVRTLGRRPVQRPLPRAREVLLVKHLRNAAARVRSLRVADTDRRTLTALLHAALERRGHQLRERFRPLLVDVLDEVGLRPQNVPERGAHQKLVEELLDRVTERGFLTVGHLRDAVSRNQLKLPDLAGPGQFLFGDQLLDTNRRLSLVFDGVYHPGEVYLRWLQRFSAAAFGTRPGRFLTKYLALPFGGAYVALEGLTHMINPVLHLLAGGETGAETAEGGEATTEHGVDLAGLPGVLLLGVFLLALMHVAPFRHGVVHALVLLYRALKGIFFDFPAFVLQQPVVRRVLESPPVRLFRRHLFKPLLVAAVVGPILPLAGISDAWSTAVGGAVFLAALLFFNTRQGRLLEEVALDGVALVWDRLRYELIPGLFRLVMDVFKRFLEEVERILYTVDEWLRFRSGQGRAAFAAKAMLGVMWFVVTYLARIVINLLIEPTVNPIKHFPVVTVAAKLIVPVIPLILDLHLTLLSPLVGSAVAGVIAGFNIFFLPGLAGFLVWELKENWKLYASNRPATLRPVLIGSHGETMLRLLRPGIHSGTVPKLYAKLRRDERQAQRTGDWRASRKHREALHHVEESVRHFAQRELAFLLGQSRCWSGRRLEIGEIGLGSNRIAVELRSPELGEQSLYVAFEEQAGWLVAGIARPGWLGQLPPEALHALRTALAGWYQLAGVSLVREQIEASFGRSFLFYDLDEEGLVVWASDVEEMEAVYDLHQGPVLRPRLRSGPAAVELPELRADQLFFQNWPVRWVEWVEVWQRDLEGKCGGLALAEGVRLLPLGSAGKN